MYYVYILKSTRDNKLYTGFTSNLKRRIIEHNRGSSATRSTKNRGPFDVVYTETVKTSKEAREREKFLKSGAGRAWFKTYIPR